MMQTIKRELTATKMTTTHLQHDGVLLVWVHQLEVLDTGHGHSAVEVEHVGAHLLVPPGRLVDEVVQVAQVPVLHAGEDRVVSIAVARAVVVVVRGGPAVVLPLNDATVLVQAYNIVCIIRKRNNQHLALMEKIVTVNEITQSNKDKTRNRRIHIIPGRATCILRGPREPSTFAAYMTEPSSQRTAPSTQKIEGKEGKNWT